MVKNALERRTVLHIRFVNFIPTRYATGLLFTMLYVTMTFMSFVPFTSGEIQNLEARFQEALKKNAQVPLSSLTPFEGAGVYVLYYKGNHPAYKDISDRPIYIGKAMPAGGRKGLSVSTRGKNLYKRIMEHKESITAAENLDVRDFTVQWLVMDSLWVGLCESLFIAHWKPVWNALLDGFGNHDPGSGRRNGLTSRWDAFHPGRSWSTLGKPRGEALDAIQKAVTEYLKPVTPATPSKP